MRLSCFCMSSSKGIGSLLLRLFFQRYFHIEQLWQIEIVPSLWSRRKVCFLYFVIKTMSPSGAKLGKFKVGQPIIKDWGSSAVLETHCVCGSHLGYPVTPLGLVGGQGEMT